MQQASSMAEVQERLQQKARDESQAADTAASDSGGVYVAPGVRFSDKLWSRLGGKMREVEKQKRRERLTDSTAFPEIPTSIFDNTYRRDAVWKQRSESFPQADTSPDCTSCGVRCAWDSSVRHTGPVALFTQDLPDKLATSPALASHQRSRAVHRYTLRLIFVVSWGWQRIAAA
eukprot:1564044-Rhodomonas_salina.2